MSPQEIRLEAVRMLAQHATDWSTDTLIKDGARLASFIENGEQVLADANNSADKVKKS